MNCRLLIVLCLLSLVVKMVPANNCRVYTSEHELPSSMVNQVYQDRDGVIWISTEDGLSRYDGANFVTFRCNEQDTVSLRNNYVRVTFEDSKGRFFVGTLTGLQLYDRATRQFKNILPVVDGLKFTQGVNVSSIVETDRGMILIGTSGHGIFALNDLNEEMVMIQDAELLPNCFYIEKMLCDSRGNLWVATPDKGVFALNIRRKIVTSRMLGDNESCFSLEESPDGNIYIGTSLGNLIRYDRRSDSYSVSVTQKQTQGAIMDIYVADSSTLLLGIDGSGLKMLDIAGREMKNYNLNLLGLNSQKLKVHSIMRDDHRNLWLGCFQQGVVLEPAIENEFTYIGSRSSTMNNVGSCCIMSVSCDADDNVWVGTDNDGIYLLNKDFSLKRHYSVDDPSKMMSRTTLCTYKDSRGNVWVGSYLGGLSKLNEVTGECVPVQIVSKDNNQAKSVYSIIEDSKQNIWVAVTSVGICRINIITGEQKLYSALPNGIGYTATANLLPNAWINTLLLCGDRLYFGSFDGLGCLDISTDDFVSAFGVNKMLSGEVVNALHEDSDGKIWIGTSRGLFCFDPQTKCCDKYTMSNGLPSNSISSIESDSDGNLWISTNNGISCLIKQNYFFANYYAADGLQCNEFSKGASGVNSKGVLFYGGMNGLIGFNPQKIKKHYSIPGIRISNFYIHNNAVAKGMLSNGRQIVDCDITKADNVYLSYYDNSFSIEFTSMEYANPERIGFMYSLDGNGWIHLQPGNNKVSFSNLKPGKHEFCVRAVDANSYSKTKKLAIVIEAPWYASKLAYGCYAIAFLLIFGLIFFYLRYYYDMRRKMLEHKHAEDLNEAKLQFFINISHEIRTPMTLIMGPLQKLIDSDANSDRQKNYNVIYRNANRILELINQLMDIRKIDKGQMHLKFQEVDIVSMIRDICDNFEYQASLQNIRLTCTSDKPDSSVWVDSKNFDKIIVNILSNAFKFTPANGEINVRISDGVDPDKTKKILCDYVQIDIEDSGSGINSDDLKRIFERFYQSRDAHNMAVSGTGVGLHLTKSLVELHHGTISAANNVDKPGCHFTIRLPKGSSHLAADEIATQEEVMSMAAERSALLDKKRITSDVVEGQVTKIKSKTKYHVLLAEDDDEIRNYIKEELLRDYHVQEYTNGVDALDAILRNAPDIVISDVMMPMMDGRTLCQKIKQNINVNYLPVVLLTALTNENDKIEGLDVGADAYLTKPFNIDVLRHTIQNLIKVRMTLKNKYEGGQSQETKVKKLEMVSPDDRLMQRVMKVVNSNISNPDLSVEMIASMVGISRVHLHRKLKELTNQSTRDFIRNVRLQQAASLLAEKKHCIAEVSTLVGFSNSAYFSTAFKDLYGMSPSEYMEQQQIKNDANTVGQE